MHLLMRTIFVLIMILGYPASNVEAKWLLHKRSFQLDEKTWEYFAPGTMKNSQLFPTRGNDGLLIKHPNDPKKQLTYLLRSSPMVRNAGDSCEKNSRIAKGKIIQNSNQECAWTMKTSDGKITIQWIYQDMKSLKLVSFSVTTVSQRTSEVMSDLKIFRKELL